MDRLETLPADKPNNSLFVSESLIPSQTHKQATTTSTTFDGLLQTPLLLKEDLKEGCGGQLWPAGMVLAKYMLRRHRTGLTNKTMFVRSSSTPISFEIFCLTSP
jgi:hypothetical protein